MKAALYRSSGLPYLPRGAPFAHVNELWLVQGLPPALVGRAIPFVTVYSGRPDINVFDAPPELIAALPGMTPLRDGQLFSISVKRPHATKILLPGCSALISLALRPKEATLFA